MELLNRYLNEIKRYLPFKDRDDTLKELENLLLEDLEVRVSNGENKDTALYDLIKEFGSPKEVALKYRDDQPIISREMEPMLYLILKIVAVTVPSGILLATIISSISSMSPFNFLDLIVDIIRAFPEMFFGTLAGIGIVFVIFVVIERFFKDQIEEELHEFNMPKFDPKNLPKIPVSVYKVSLFESLFLITMSILFLYFLNYQQGIISIYYDGTNEELLNAHFNSILPILNVSVIFAMIIEIIHLIKRRKTLITTTLAFMQTILAGVILILLSRESIFNKIIIEGYDLEIIPKLFVIGMIIGAIAHFIGGSVTYGKVLIAHTGQGEVLKDIINKNK